MEYIGGVTKFCGPLTGGVTKCHHLHIGGCHKIMNAQNASKCTFKFQKFQNFPGRTPDPFFQQYIQPFNIFISGVFFTIHMILFDL